MKIKKKIQINLNKLETVMAKISEKLTEKYKSEGNRNTRLFLVYHPVKNIYY